MAFVVYGLFDPKTGEIRYVGKTERSERERFRNHKCLAKKERSHLYNWWRSTAPQEPKMIVLEKCLTIEELNRKEQKWIADLRKVGACLVNILDGGEGGGRLWNDEEKSRMSKRMAILWQNPQYREQMITERKARYCKHPEKFKAFIGAQKNQAAEASRLIMAKAHGNKGAIVDELGRVYSSKNEAHQILRVSRRGICKVLNGIIKQTGGHSFRYLEEAPALSERNLTREELGE